MTSKTTENEQLSFIIMSIREETHISCTFAMQSLEWLQSGKFEGCLVEILSGVELLFSKV